MSERLSIHTDTFKSISTLQLNVAHWNSIGFWWLSNTPGCWQTALNSHPKPTIPLLCSALLSHSARSLQSDLSRMCLPVYPVRTSLCAKKVRSATELPATDVELTGLAWIHLRSQTEQQIQQKSWVLSFPPKYHNKNFVAEAFPPCANNSGSQKTGAAKDLHLWVRWGHSVGTVGFPSAGAGMLHWDHVPNILLVRNVLWCKSKLRMEEQAPVDSCWS